MSDVHQDVNDVAGTNIWRSARNIYNISTEMAALGNEVFDALTGKPRSGLLIRAHPKKRDKVGTNWISTSYTNYLVVFPQEPRRRGPKKALGVISICRSIYSPTEEVSDGWEGAQVPKIFIGYSTNGPWLADNFALSGDGVSTQCAATPPHLWHWRLEDGEVHRQSWFFCVPIIRLTSTNLESEVIEPLIKLIIGEDQTRAFPTNAVACKAPA